MSNKLLQILLNVKGSEQSKKKISGVQSSIVSLGKSALVTAGAFFGGRALLGAFKSAITLAGEQQRVEAQLNQVIKSTGGVAGVTAKQVKEMASAFQETTRFGDETIINASNLMLTFTKIGEDVFPKAIESVLNMSQAMGQDLQQTVIQVGKALNDPIMGVTALRRVGIQLSDEQTNMIKSFMEVSDVASAQQIILGELETQFGGLAKSGNETSEFALAQMSNAFGDLGESIGTALTPMLLSASSGFKSLAEGMKTIVENSPVDNLREQQIEVNALANALANNLENEEMRNELFTRLQRIYPSLLGNLKKDELNTKNITKALSEHNKKFQERINLAVSEQLVKEKIEETTEAFENQVQANLKLADQLKITSDVTGVAIDTNLSFEGQIKAQTDALNELTKESGSVDIAMSLMAGGFTTTGANALESGLLIEHMNARLQDTRNAEEDVSEAVDSVTKFRTELNQVMKTSLSIQDEIITTGGKEISAVDKLTEAYARLQARKNAETERDSEEIDSLFVSFDQNALDEEMAELQEALDVVDLNLPEPPPYNFGQAVEGFLLEQAPALEAGYDQFINSLVDIDMNGKERREQMFIASRNAFIRTSGEMLKAHIKTKLLEENINKSSATKEIALKTLTSAKSLAIEKASALKSMVIANTQAMAGIIANMAKATASAIAGLGPMALVGAPLVIAGMAAISKTVQASLNDRKGFADGGMVSGVGNTDSVPAMLTAGELVLNQAQQNNLADSLGNQGQVININISAPLVDESIIDTIIPAINSAVSENRASLLASASIK